MCPRTTTSWCSTNISAARPNLAKPRKDTQRPSSSLLTSKNRRHRKMCGSVTPCLRQSRRRLYLRRCKRRAAGSQVSRSLTTPTSTRLRSRCSQASHEITSGSCRLPGCRLSSLNPNLWLIKKKIFSERCGRNLSPPICLRGTRNRQPSRMRHTASDDLRVIQLALYLVGQKAPMGGSTQLAGWSARRPQRTTSIAWSRRCERPRTRWLSDTKRCSSFSRSLCKRLPSRR